MAGSDQPGRQPAVERAGHRADGAVRGRAAAVLLLRAHHHPDPHRRTRSRSRRSPPTATRAPGGRWRCSWPSGCGAFGAYYVPRRNETRSFSLLITGGLGVSTIVLGRVQRVELHRAGEPVLRAAGHRPRPAAGHRPDLRRGLRQRPALPARRSRWPGCSGRCCWSSRRWASWPRCSEPSWTGWWSGSPARLVVLVGLSEDAIPLIRRLANDLPRRTVLAVLVADADHPLTKLTREIGARVVVCDLETPARSGPWCCGRTGSRCRRSTWSPPTSRPT